MDKRKRLQAVFGVLGIGPANMSWRDALVSGVGGCLAITAIVLVSQRFVGIDGAGLLVASMGASAVLLFAVPEGPLSQPWAVMGGHVLSAFIGVSCAAWVSDPLLAAALAVGSSIGMMQVLRCVHPPGGATALSAVVGGSSVHALGLQYVLTPVLLNTVVIVTVAVAFHGVLGRRRYPAYFARPAATPKPPWVEAFAPDADSDSGVELGTLPTRPGLVPSPFAELSTGAAREL
jgi:CBS-domain-containing membrane protein